MPVPPRVHAHGDAATRPSHVQKPATGRGVTRDVARGATRGATHDATAPRCNGACPLAWLVGLTPCPWPLVAPAVGGRARAGSWAGLARSGPMTTTHTSVRPPRQFMVACPWRPRRAPLRTCPSPAAICIAAAWASLCNPGRHFTPPLGTFPWLGQGERSRRRQLLPDAIIDEESVSARRRPADL